MAFFSINLALQLLGIIIGIVGAAYIYLKHVTYNYWSSRGIAQLEPIAPIGDLWPLLSGKRSIGQLMHDGYLRLRKKRIFGFYCIHKPNLVICDPDILRFVLTKEFPRFQDRGMFSDEKLDPMSGNLFMTGGPKWRYLRMKFSPTFTSGKMKHMFTIVKEISDNLDKRLTYEAKQNELVEIKDLMARFSTDVIATVAFGIDCNSLEDPDAEFRSWGRKFLESNPLKNALMALCPSVLQILKIPVFDKGASDFILNAFTDTVNYRTANNVVRKDFLDLAMQLINKGCIQGDEDDDNKETAQNSVNASDKITMLDGAAQAFVFWIAGFETSSSTVTHCTYELALNQEIQEKMANEINTVLEKFGGLTYESINEMPYLHKVVSETLRKYPSVPLLNRECNREVQLFDTGFVVPIGTPIIVPVLGIHFDPDIYPDPDKFDPERFSDENIAKRHKYAYLPFGEGPRNCIGMRFGLLQTKIGLITLFSKYRFKPGPDTKVPLPIDKGHILHGPLGGVTLKVEERY